MSEQITPEVQEPSVRSASIFLSHKAKDRVAAEVIKKVLQGRSGRLQVHIFEEKTAGSPWEEWVEETLRASDLLLLLYTDCTSEWDWCLFEAGWFTPLRSEERRPVVCLYNPRCCKPPKPLRSLEAVEATKEALISKFLRPLYRSADLIPIDPLLNPGVSDEALAQDADQIVAQIVPAGEDQGEIEAFHYQERIMIELPDLSLVAESEAIPDSTAVRALSGQLALLDFQADHFTWGELREIAKPTRGYGTFWLDELERGILAAAKKKLPTVLTGTFRALHGGKIYRPILYRVDRENQIPRRFYVAFNPEIEPELIGGPGKNGLAFNLLRLGSRFRWEVIDPFLNRVQRATGPPELGVVCKQLRESIEAIENEAQRHLRLDQHSVRDLLEDDWEEVEVMLGKWEVVRSTLFREASAPEPDGQMLLEELEALRTMNRRWMFLVAKEYQRVLESEWRSIAPVAPEAAAAGGQMGSVPLAIVTSH